LSRVDLEPELAIEVEASESNRSWRASISFQQKIGHLVPRW